MLRKNARLLGGHQVLFVGVKCDLEELIGRERSRPEKVRAVVERQFEGMNRRRYDIEVDATSTTPKDCAAEVFGVALAWDRRSALFDYAD